VPPALTTGFPVGVLPHLPAPLTCVCRSVLRSIRAQVKVWQASTNTTNTISDHVIVDRLNLLHIYGLVRDVSALPVSKTGI